MAEEIVAADNIEVVRVPMEPTEHPRRRIEERLGVRFPRLLAAFGWLAWRLPGGLRRSIAHRFVRIAWEALNRKDLEACFMLYHPDCESTYPVGMTTLGVEPGTYNREERIRSQDRLMNEWSAFGFEPEELIFAGDDLLSIGRMKATGQLSGASVDTDWAAIFTIRDARVIRERIFTDRKEALKTVGLSA